MIWALVTNHEMENYGTSPVFNFYREAIGRNNIKLLVVDENSELSCINNNDIVLLRTASEKLINTIREKGIKTTAEEFESYEFVKDKICLGKYLSDYVLIPKQYSLNNLEDGKEYFVKPRFGSDSFGINENSICKTKEEVIHQVNWIKSELKQEALIEDYIDGNDYTVACVNNSLDNHFMATSIKIICEKTNSVQTRLCKVYFQECCEKTSDYENRDLYTICHHVFSLLKLKHHARIDFRKGKDNKFYLIDVNLMPGLGPIDHFAKCMLLSKNISYTDTLRYVIDSASILNV